MTMTSLARYLFLLGWLKLNMSCQISWDWLRETNTGSSCDWFSWSSFFGFLSPDLAPWEYRNRCFLVAICRYERERSATKRLLHQQVKRLVVLVTFRAQKCVPKSISGSVDIPKVHDCDLLRQMSSQWGSQN